jgi:hypothetical protein
LILQERCAGCFMQDCLQRLPSWCFLQRFRFRTCGMFRWRHVWLQMMYPFVTFWRLEQWRYLLLALVVLVGLLGIIAVVTAAVQLFLQNSYFSFAVLGLLFMGAYLLAYVQMGNVWDLIRELFNPTVLYATSGGWFMENDLRLSFAGNEFAVLFCSGTATVCLMAVGKRRYHRLEV